MAANPWAARLTKPPLSESSPASDMGGIVRAAIAENAASDSVVEQKLTPETVPADSPRLNADSKLSQLVSEDFPFDESQLAAVEGMANAHYACLTGAAGTGKTTTTKKLVDVLINSVGVESVNMAEYFKKGYEPDDPNDDYEVPENFIPAICLISFTGRATQMIKKNFPRDWHGNIMTIHRCLAYAPEYYDDFDDETGDLRHKMRFVPTYTADIKLPWDIVIIDEAGMTGLELWHQLWAAMKPGARIYMIGDINQLPPVHGRSVFGFAMSRWPSFELTHIHRQQGANNAIVENAWRVLNGQQPVSGGNFQMMELKGDAQKASRIVRALMPKMMEGGVYEPNRDTIITAINGNEGSRGYALGQLPLNREFAMIFNPKSEHPRYIIDSGRDKKMFAVGDKVMATKNDHQAGITNGMTGIITEITRNDGYGGDSRRFGLVDEVNEWMASEGFEDEGEEFTLEELQADFESKDDGEKKKEEGRGRGPASHTVLVRFGEEEHGFELPFVSLSEVDSLMTAYVVTCHKMQGGESPTIIIICHDAHKQMLYREWLYTAITRASQRCYLLYTPTALRTAISKQNIRGSSLKEKITAFNALGRDNGLGAAVKVILPEATGTEHGQDIGARRATVDGNESSGGGVSVRDLGALVVRPDSGLAAQQTEPSQVATVDAPTEPIPYAQPLKEEPVHASPLDRLLGKKLHVTIRTTHIHVHGEAASQPQHEVVNIVESEPVKPLAVTPPTQPKLTRWAAPKALRLTYDKPLLLTHQPKPEPIPVKANPWANRLAAKKELV